MHNAEYKPVIVLGMHRSGTSLLAELVHRWGAYAGRKEDLFSGDEWNPRGYWESRPLVALNNDLLLAVDSSGWRPPADEAERVLTGFAEAGAFRDRALELLAKMREPGKPWFWKDPRLAVLMPFWKRLWGEVVYIIPVRNPLEVATSLTFRDRPSFSAALLLWQVYMTGIIRSTSGQPNRLFIEYESLITDSNRQVFRLCRFLSDQVGIEGSHSLNVAGAVDPSLRRSQSRRASIQTCNLTYGQEELYKALRQLVYDSEDQTPADILRLPDKWRAYLTYPGEVVPDT